MESLRVDASLAFTFVQTAKLEAQYDPSRARAAILKARRALESIRRLSGYIRDQRNWQEIHAKADKLEAALAEITASNNPG